MDPQPADPDQWKAAYQQAFIKHALARRWRQEDAAAWAADIADDACAACLGEDVPVDEVARLDVLESEQEAARAAP